MFYLFLAIKRYFKQRLQSPFQYKIYALGALSSVAVIAGSGMTKPWDEASPKHESTNVYDTKSMKVNIIYCSVFFMKMVILSVSQSYNKNLGILKF